jgi:hypothetical protein
MPAQANASSYRLTNLDASFLYQESAVSQMHGAMIFFLKGELPFDRLFPAHRGTAPRIASLPSAPRLLAFNIGHPTLEDDPDFRLENHVQFCEPAKRDSEKDAVNEILRFDNSRLLDHTRPLWCVTLFSGSARTVTGIVGIAPRYR